MKLVFATHNNHKAQEIQQIINNHNVVTLADVGLHEDIPETGETLQDNALIKARYVFSKLKTPCFADDTGLEVEALNGAPGVHSARYAGENKNSEDNIDKLLNELKNNDNRKACFRCVIAYIDEQGNEHLFEGRVDGVISNERQGNKGFGYDSVFIPEGFDISFAQADAEIKNEVSHRGKAVRKFVEYVSDVIL